MAQRTREEFKKSLDDNTLKLTKMGVRPEEATVVAAMGVMIELLSDIRETLVIIKEQYDDKGKGTSN